MDETNYLADLEGEMMTNAILQAIRNRRSATRFETDSIEEEKIQSVLEAGRWAPSWLNRQPWRFVLVRHQHVKDRLSEHVATTYRLGIGEAPICIVVCVDPEEDPYHFIEDGAAATQNMALAAHSLGLGSCWIGVFNLKGEEGSPEERIKDILELPKTYRVISLLPIGIPKYIPVKKRKHLSQLIYRDNFQKAS